MASSRFNTIPFPIYILFMDPRCLWLTEHNRKLNTDDESKLETSPGSSGTLYSRTHCWYCYLNVTSEEMNFTWNPLVIEFQLSLASVFPPLQASKLHVQN